LNDRAVGFINQLVQFRLLGLHLDRLADIVTAVPEADAAAPQSLDVKGAIKVRDLSFRYGASDQLILQDTGFDIEPGSFVAITGPSGGGKTTLLKLLLGLHQMPTAPAAGTRSCSSASRFAPSAPKMMFTPVTLPPGRLKFVTKPIFTASPPVAKTTGMVAVAAFAARPEAPPPTAAMTATRWPTNSLASAARRS
jgi:hypothetical protein